MKILICFGTRPEIIKLLPLINESKLSKKHTVDVLYVEQHKNLIENEIISIKYKINISNNDRNNRLNQIISDILVSDIPLHDYEYIIVQGDTASAYGCALKAYQIKVPIIHLEAGLRTWEINPYPEEFYRKSISSMATIHLCPTDMNKNILIDEKQNGKIYVVGNTIIDSLKNIIEKEKIQIALPNESNIIIITLHRRENWDTMKNFFECIEKISLENLQYQFIIPLHMNPYIQNMANCFKNVKVCDPLSHIEFVKLMASSRLIISDSGGIQEEGAWLGRKILLCRDKTERQELIETNVWLTPTIDELYSKFNQHILYPNAIQNNIYGNGDTSLKILNILDDLNN